MWDYMSVRVCGWGGVGVGDRPSFVEHAGSGYGFGARVTWWRRIRDTWEQVRGWVSGESTYGVLTGWIRVRVHHTLLDVAGWAGPGIRL